MTVSTPIAQRSLVWAPSVCFVIPCSFRETTQCSSPVEKVPVSLCHACKQRKRENIRKGVHGEGLKAEKGYGDGEISLIQMRVMRMSAISAVARAPSPAKFHYQWDELQQCSNIRPYLLLLQRRSVAAIHMALDPSPDMTTMYYHRQSLLRF